MNHQYRKKSPIIEAVQMPLDRQAVDAPLTCPWLLDAFVDETITLITTMGPTHWLIETLGGVRRADIGDWVVEGIDGDLYPCKPDIFEATYDAVLDADDLTKTMLAEQAHMQELDEFIDGPRDPDDEPQMIEVAIGGDGLRVPVNVNGIVRWITVNTIQVPNRSSSIEGDHGVVTTIFEALNTAAKDVLKEAVDIGLSYLDGGPNIRKQGAAVDDAVGTASKVGGLPYEPAEKSDSEIGEEVAWDMVVDAALENDDG
jgi:hypothetical protein